MGIPALRSWSRKMGLPGLQGLGLSSADYSKVAEAASKASSMSGNPFALSQHELLEILHSAK